MSKSLYTNFQGGGILYLLCRYTGMYLDKYKYCNTSQFFPIHNNCPGNFLEDAGCDRSEK